MPDESNVTAHPLIVPRDSSLEELVKIESKRRVLLKEYRTLRAQRDEMRKELAEYKAKPVDPTVEQLRAELSEIKHRQVFDRLASDAKVKSRYLDDLWRLSGYKVDQHADVINEDALRAVVAEQQKTRPDLFESASGEAPAVPPARSEEPLKPGPGNSRGGLVRDAGKFRVSRRDLKNPTPALQSQLNEEYKKGNVEIID
jgi:hypothetical protein